jgi:hypothetical protein
LYDVIFLSTLVSLFLSLSLSVGYFSELVRFLSSSEKSDKIIARGRERERERDRERERKREREKRERERERERREMRNFRRLPLRLLRHLPARR